MPLNKPLLIFNTFTWKFVFAFQNQTFKFKQDFLRNALRLRSNQATIERTKRSVSESCYLISSLMAKQIGTERRKFGRKTWQVALQGIPLKPFSLRADWPMGTSGRRQLTELSSNCLLVDVSIILILFWIANRERLFTKHYIAGRRRRVRVPIITIDRKSWFILIFWETAQRMPFRVFCASSEETTAKRTAAFKSIRRNG